MMIEVFNQCFRDPTYSDNGISLRMSRFLPIEGMENIQVVTLKFEDDDEKEIFSCKIAWEKFKEMVKRIDD